MGAQQGKLTTSHIVGRDEHTKQEQHFNSVPECLCYFAKTKPDRDALVFYSTTEPRFAVTFKELYGRSCKMAAAFEHLGLQAGETVVFVSRSCPEWYYCAIGAMMLKARIITAHVSYNDGSDVIKLMEKLVNCSMFVLDPGPNDSNWNSVKKIIDRLDKDGKVTSTKMPYLRNLIFLSKPDDPNEIYKTASQLLEESNPKELQEISSGELAVFFQTSGSTGDPKFVAYTHENILKSRHLYTSGNILGDFNKFCDRPYFWISGFLWENLKGCTRTSIYGLCPEPRNYIGFVMHVIQAEKCNLATMLPPIIYDLVKRQDDIPADWPLQTILTGSQPITRSLTACVGKICQRLCVLYGSSEFILSSGYIVEKDTKYVDYACGRPPGGCEIKVIDDQGQVVPLGERGEIYVRAEWQFKEYFNESEKTKVAKTDDGWYKTDDHGRINSDGILFVEGRKSDIIISGGKNVAPFILQAVLKAHPGVEEAVIVPVPDVELFQAICACVKIKQGSGVTETILREYIEQTHTDKTDLFTGLPKYYMILHEFPLEKSGKVSRRTLKTMAVDQFGQTEK